MDLFNIQDVITGIYVGDLLAGSEVRSVRVPAKSVVELWVQVVVERIGRLLPQTPNLGRIQSFVDQPGCRNGGQVVSVVILIYRRLVPQVLQTVRRRRWRCQRSLARGSPQHEGTTVSVGIRYLWIP